MFHRYGRKRALFLSILLTFIGYALTAFSVSSGNLVLLFFSRVITGVFSGNLSVCLASISDLSTTEKSKAKNFGYLSILSGFSFIIGAFLGGKLSDPEIHPLFNPAFPLWIAAAMSLLNLLFIIFGFEETFHPQLKQKFDFLEGIHNVQKGLKTKNIKSIYLIYFLFVFAWTLIFQFSPVLVINKFNFTHSEIGNLAALMGVGWAIGAGPVNKFLTKRFSTLKILEVALIIFTALSLLVGFAVHLTSVILLLGACVTIGGLAWPLCTVVISNQAPQQMQGKILGVSQSMQSLAMAVSPIIGGISDELYVQLPFILSAVASFIAGLIYFRIKI
ncbi:MAG: MFS transporter [Chlamydiae bacterium]|nr:MFS transporter [Chlamydiota bacterium]